MLGAVTSDHGSCADGCRRRSGPLFSHCFQDAKNEPSSRGSPGQILSLRKKQVAWSLYGGSLRHGRWHARAILGRRDAVIGAAQFPALEFAKRPPRVLTFQQRRFIQTC